MDQSVERLNLEYYRKRLATETDSTIRQILLRLIAEEEARQSQQTDQAQSSRQGS